VTASRDFAATRELIEPEARQLIARYPESRSALLPILHAFQNVEGWVSPEALAATAEWLELPLSVVESTASFYTLFFRKPVGKYMLQPCRGLSCAINGAYETMRHFREKLGVENLETTPDGTFSYEEVECLAACDRAPCMQVNLEFLYDLTPEKIDEMLAAMRAGTFEIAPLPQSVAPGPNWHVGQDPAQRSPGAQGVSNPNAPGGIGDASGRRILERLTADPAPVEARPTNERSIAEGPASALAARNGDAH
jgi:NADH-quinone oxidoreductase E subunit